MEGGQEQTGDVRSRGHCQLYLLVVASLGQAANDKLAVRLIGNAESKWWTLADDGVWTSFCKHCDAEYGGEEGGSPNGALYSPRDDLCRLAIG